MELDEWRTLLADTLSEAFEALATGLDGVTLYFEADEIPFMDEDVLVRVERPPLTSVGANRLSKERV